ncbi:MAG: helix-turn-helix domain-containing protein [Candidatus Omnitrophota bacterium]
MKTKHDTEKINDLFLNAGKGKIYNSVITETERMLIGKALERSFGNQSIAAKILGVNRNTLRFKIKRFGIDVNKFKI